ncbi:MAG TPA: DUF523 domain-containing protein [Vicinamibacterales bacterium]|nr:DUF523 domain-containing protein [Vicinamibacterales bacterium]
MIRVLVSACLLGEKVRHDGRDAASSHPVVRRWLDEGRVVRFCPEVAGGLGVPRPPAEIVDGRVRTQDGRDVTAGFDTGARLALGAAQTQNARVAVLKEGSPSCGTHRISDGSFTGRKIEGRGVTAALLERHGIRVFSEDEIEEAAEYLRGLENHGATMHGAHGER